MKAVRQALFALRVVQRRAGTAAIVYRRTLNKKMEERLTRVAAVGPLGYTSGLALLRASARASGDGRLRLAPGPYFPLDADWGVRVACYALVASGLRNAERMHRAATHLRQADPTEAAWWFVLMTGRNSKRARRALRVLLEAVK